MDGTLTNVSPLKSQITSLIQSSKVPIITTSSLINFQYTFEFQFKPVNRWNFDQYVFFKIPDYESHQKRLILRKPILSDFYLGFSIYCKFSSMSLWDNKQVESETSLGYL